MYINDQVGGDDWVDGYWFWWLLVPQLLLLMTVSAVSWQALC